MNNKKHWEHSAGFFTIRGYKDRIYISGSLDKKSSPRIVAEEMSESFEEVSQIINLALRSGAVHAENQYKFDKRMLDMLKGRHVPEGLETYTIEFPVGEGEEPRRGVWAFDCPEEQKQKTLDEFRAMGAKILPHGA
jgi:hypothetical protein